MYGNKSSKTYITFKGLKLMSNNFNFIQNNTLQLIRRLSAKHLIRDHDTAKTKLVKIYQSETEIIYQVKNTLNKKAVRVVIPISPMDGLVATLILRTKNPNTIEYFDDFFSIVERTQIYDEVSLDAHFVRASIHLESSNEKLKNPFVKIETTLDKGSLTKDKLLLKKIESVRLNNSHYQIKLTDEEVFLIDKNIKFKLPFAGDLMFTDINGKYQFYSQAKARYHFELH